MLAPSLALTLGVTCAVLARTIQMQPGAKRLCLFIAAGARIRLSSGEIGLPKSGGRAYRLDSKSADRLAGSSCNGQLAASIRNLAEITQVAMNPSALRTKGRAARSQCWQEQCFRGVRTPPQECRMRLLPIRWLLQRHAFGYKVVPGHSELNFATKESALPN